MFSLAMLGTSYSIVQIAIMIVVIAAVCAAGVRGSSSSSGLLFPDGYNRSLMPQLEDDRISELRSEVESLKRQLIEAKGRPS